MKSIDNTTTPGIRPGADYSKFTSEEKVICKNLSEKYWYLTRFNQTWIADSCYNSVFLRPTQEISVEFNLHREVVLIFCNYPEFMPRCLEVIDEFNVQEQRLEEICCIIVSKDSDLENKINQYLKKDKESRVIIPFTYDELFNKYDNEAVRNKFREHFYQRDLFDLQVPLKKDLYFFGRTSLIHTLANKHLTDELAGVFGLRKSGKTSILFGVERVLDKKQSVFYYIDCETLHTVNWRIALHSIVSKLAEKCGVEQKLIHKQDHYKSEDIVISDIFIEDIKHIYNKNGKRSILLVFDEIEHITFDTSASEGWRSGEYFLLFWQTLRSAYHQLQGKSIFTFLIAGTNPLCVEKSSINGSDNPLFQQFKPTFIAPFEIEHTKDMVQRLGGYMGLIFTDEICTHLNEDFGGHPLLIRQMCSFIHRQIIGERKQRPFEIDKAFYNQCKKNFYESESGFIKYVQMILCVLENNYPDEYYMLEQLAIGNYVDFNGLAAQDKTYISHLLNYGVIAKNSVGDGYSFRIEALEDYLRKNTKYKRLNLSQEEMWLEICERRNRAECKLRDLVRKTLKARYGEVDATDIIKKELIGVEGKKDSKTKRLHNPVYRDYFDPNKVDIFFKTLLGVIRSKYDDCFRNVFDVDISTFDNRTELLNSYGRSDCHGKKISENEFKRFRIDMEWLEQKLEENL
jgi:hypothetical protein